MKDLWKLLEPFWKWLGLPGTAAMFGFLAVVGPMLWKYVKQLWILRKQRLLKRDLFPFYTALEVKRATQYYVETKCQNVAPSKEEELQYDDGTVVKKNILPFFLKKAFHPKKDDCQFYLVLADSGMGKTTFLINLYLRYINQFRQPDYQIKLFPLGFPEIDKEIEKIPDDEKRQTILLLDAFDEDIQAVTDYKARLDELIHKVTYFREVVITCRTQFFPSEKDVPKETGVMRHGVEGGERVFYEFYLSPFDDNDIQIYLKKRFPFPLFQRTRRKIARQIVLSCPNLMVRPMLLSYIEDLLQEKQPYTATYRVYAELINKWIERETDKVSSAQHKDYSTELYQFSREIALDLYCHRTERPGGLMISRQEIQPFADRHNITLSAMEMKSKSLLNRNAQGYCKFSHKSILEYFLAEEAFFNPEFRQELNFGGMSQAHAFFQEIIWEKLTVPFFSRPDLNGEYRLKNTKSEMLAKMNIKSLPEVTYLKLREWNPEDDVLLFKGLQHLERFYLPESQTPSEQKDELQYMLSDSKMGFLLRSKTLAVSENEFKQVFGLDGNQRPLKYTQNEYEAQGKVVVDHTTGLTWQKAGSPNYITYQDAQEYVKKLNRKRFAEYSDWRLPTIPELMSLLEPKEQSNGLYINPIFDKEQFWCWSADKRLIEGGSSSSAWYVNFDFGYVDWNPLDGDLYVRAVRS